MDPKNRCGDPHASVPVVEGGGEDPRDATRRTHLANERTYLAWWRTGLASLAVSVGTGKLVPDLTGGVQWPFTIAGVGFALLGVAFIAYAGMRHRRVRDAIARGEFEHPDEWFVTTLAVAGTLLGLLVLLLVLVEN